MFCKSSPTGENSKDDKQKQDHWVKIQILVSLNNWMNGKLW